MYKDKDKQREANRTAKARQRAKLVGHDVLNPVTKICIEGMTKGMTSEGMTGKHPDDVVIPDADFTRLMAQAGPGHVRVSKPGDADYVPQCETTRAFIEGVA